MKKKLLSLSVVLALAAGVALTVGLMVGDSSAQANEPHKPGCEQSCGLFAQRCNDGCVVGKDPAETAACHQRCAVTVQKCVASCRDEGPKLEPEPPK
jgi:hypothetical protein